MRARDFLYSVIIGGSAYFPAYSQDLKEHTLSAQEFKESELEKKAQTGLGFAGDFGIFVGIITCGLFLYLMLKENRK